MRITLSDHLWVWDNVGSFVVPYFSKPLLSDINIDVDIPRSMGIDFEILSHVRLVMVAYLKWSSWRPEDLMSWIWVLQVAPNDCVILTGSWGLNLWAAQANDIYHIVILCCKHGTIKISKKLKGKGKGHTSLKLHWTKSTSPDQ
jgi:hypothetical protein